MAGATTGVDVFGPDVTGGSALSGQFFAGQFGDGSDGDLTVVTSYSAGREMHFNNLTIPAGTFFKPNGYRIYVAGTLTIGSGASFNDDGNSSTSQAGGLILNSRNYLGAAAGQGGNGWALTAVNWANGNAGNGSGGNSSYNNLGQAPAGSKGGDVTLRANTGGAGGGAAQPTPWQKWNSRWFDGRFSGGTFNGGGAGGGGAINVVTYTSGTFISGGGGGGGGIVWLSARYIVNAGRISANGGKGGDGVLGVGTGECAGGGGGGAGNVTVITQTPAASLGTIQAAGGLGGTGVWNTGTGVGINGTAGVAGSVCIVVMS